MSLGQYNTTTRRYPQWDAYSTDIFVWYSGGSSGSTVSDVGVDDSGGFPLTASGLVATVVNNSGAALAGTTWLKGYAISSEKKLQICTNAVGADAVWVQGIACTPFGAVYVSTSAVFHAANAGLPLSGSGALLVEENGTPDTWVRGIPITEAGRVCVGSAT